MRRGICKWGWAAVFMAAWALAGQSDVPEILQGTWKIDVEASIASLKESSRFADAEPEALARLPRQVRHQADITTVTIGESSMVGQRRMLRRSADLHLVKSEANRWVYSTEEIEVDEDGKPIRKPRGEVIFELHEDGLLSMISKQHEEMNPYLWRKADETRQ